MEVVNKKEVVCREVVELATDYLEETLLEPLRSLLETHLEECDGCREYLEQLRQTIRFLHSYGQACPPAAVDVKKLTKIFRSWAATSTPPGRAQPDPGPALD